MKVMFGILGALLFVTQIGQIEGSISAFVNTSSLIFSVLVPVTLLLFHYSLSQCVGTFRAVVLNQDGAQSLRVQVGVLSVLRRMVLAGGTLGFLVGMVQLLAHIDTPKMIGPALAVSMLSILVALLGAELILSPLIHKCVSRLAAEGETGDTGSLVVQRSGERSAFLLLSLVFTVLGCVSTGQPWELFNEHCLILVVGLTGFIALANYSFAEVSAAVSGATGERALSSEEAHQGLGLLSMLRALALASGCMGTIIGLIHMLVNLDDPSGVAPSVSVALISLLYGVALAELFVAPLIEHLVVTEPSLLPARSAMPASTGPFVVAVVVAAWFLLYVILDALGAS